MINSTERANLILQKVRAALDEDRDPNSQVGHIISLILFIQNFCLASELRSVIGDQVYSGPFKGMKLTPCVLTGAFGPVLLGTYEHELHGIIERVISTPYQNILNIGCGYGYYSVGLALRMPSAKIYGFDTDKGEQERSQGMVNLNNVQDRVSIAGLFEGKDFAHYAKQKTLIFIDIEGGEIPLLDPEKFPVLQEMDVIVELHNCFDPNISSIIQKRFSPTHDIELIYNKSSLFDFSPLIGEDKYSPPLDGLAITYENRSGPTPWAYMKSRNNQ